jgi:hypothetical protein
MTATLPDSGCQLRVNSSLVSVKHAELFAVDVAGESQRITLTRAQLAQALVPSNDRGGDPRRARTDLWRRFTVLYLADVRVDRTGSYAHETQ